MLAAFRVIFRALNDVRLQGYPYIWANFAFMVCSLPIITLPAAYSALMRVAHTAQTQPWEADLALFWETFKANLGRAALWGLAHAAFAIINLSNLTIYAGRTEFIWRLLTLGWWGATFVWIGVLLYTWTIYYELEQPNLWLATRNAGVMVILNPLFTLTLITFIILLSAVSTVFIAAWLLLTWGVIAAVSSTAVHNRLAIFRGLSEVKYHNATIRHD